MKVDTPVTGSVDEATSQTVDICRCLLILGIVCIHCQIEVPPDAPAWLHDFRYFFQVILPSVCVPGFFVISGCWLFRSYDGVLFSDSLSVLESCGFSAVLACPENTRNISFFHK